MKDLTDFFHKVEKLKRVKRTGWVREGVPDPESVAAHCFGIAMFCYFKIINLLGKNYIYTHEIEVLPRILLSPS